MNDMHPIHHVHDGYINSYTLGRRLNLLNPVPEDITIEDIAGSLSKLCRWNGKGSEFFSVAQHCVLVSYLAPKELRFAALMHDAAEAYLGDVAKPLKVILGPVYARLENNFEDLICSKFKIARLSMLSVKPWDKLAAEMEFEYLFQGKTEAFGKVFNDLHPC